MQHCLKRYIPLIYRVTLTNNFVLESGKIKYEIDCYKPALGLLVSKILMNIILIIIYNISVPFFLLVFKNIQQKRSFPQFFILDIVILILLKEHF